MGRYYDGDIEGRFAFGVQDSNDADYFGVSGVEPNYLEYWFQEEDLDGVKQGIRGCEAELGEYNEKISKFFKQNDYYNDEELGRHLELDKEKVRALLIWYFRLKLGKKIEKCLEEKGECSFRAEL